MQQIERDALKQHEQNLINLSQQSLQNIAAVWTSETNELKQQIERAHQQQITQMAALMKETSAQHSQLVQGLLDQAQADNSQAIEQLAKIKNNLDDQAYQLAESTENWQDEISELMSHEMKKQNTKMILAAVVAGVLSAIITIIIMRVLEL